MKVISVFGSSAPKPGSQDFEQAKIVGRLLAESGFAVASGGYGGTMTAVSQGAAMVGGHVIGIASVRIERYRGATVNPWVKEVHQYETLSERMMHLVTHNVGMIALPGGIGTLCEVMLSWNLLQVGELEVRPFALLGSIWRETLENFYDPIYVKAKDMQLLYLADTPETAVAHVAQKGVNES